MLLTKQDVLQLRKSLWFFVQSGHCEVRQWPAPTTTVTTIACRSHQQDLFHNLDWISQQQKLSSSVLLEALPERDASKCYIKLPSFWRVVFWFWSDTTKFLLVMDPSAQVTHLYWTNIWAKFLPTGAFTFAFKIFEKTQTALYARIVDFVLFSSGNFGLIL